MSGETWTNLFPAAKNSASNMPDQTNGELSDGSQITKLKEFAIAIQDKIGTDLAEPGTHEKRLDDLEAAGGGGSAPGTLTTTKPAGVTADIEAYWDFTTRDGSELTDRTGNGHTLTRIGGPGEQFATAGRHRDGILYTAGGPYYQAASHAALQITGALTVECVVTPDTPDGIGRRLFSHELFGTPDTEDKNTLYSLHFPAGGSTQATLLEIFHEYGAGASNYFALFPNGFVSGHVAQCVTLTRSTDGLTYKIYLGGKLQGTLTVPGGQAPTGGTLGQFTMGAAQDGSGQFKGIFHEIRITPEEFTAAQVAEAAALVI